MANARIVIGTTGGQMELSESTGVTGATGYGTIYTSSVDNKPHFVDTNGTDSVIALGAAGELALYGTCSLYTPNVNSNLSASSGCFDIAIGPDTLIDSTASGHIAIGAGANVCCGSNLGKGTALGFEARGNRYWGTAIGACANSGQEGQAFGYCSLTTGYAFPVALGACARALGPRSVAVGFRSTACANGDFSGTAIGFNSVAANCYTNAIGIGAQATAVSSTAIGQAACATHTSSVAIGCAVTTERTNTTHVNSLLAYGQGVSKGHDIGSTGGTVTVDWDNSNTQKISLSSNITSLTLSNPIQGGVYSLIVEQTTSGGNTITWPAGSIKWPGGTPPTLTSGATGDTDVISLIYDPAGGTGYLGNANLAFS